MNLDELLAFLELERCEEFSYFESFADLMETDQPISSETLYQLISRVRMDVFVTLLDAYFDDVLNNLPEDAWELYTLIQTIRMMLYGFGKYAREERNMVLFSDELYRFREWFRFEKNVRCEDVEGTRIPDMSVFDAVVLYRTGCFDDNGRDEYSFDFEACLDYSLDEYVVSFSNYGEPDNLEEECEYEEE